MFQVVKRRVGRLQSSMSKFAVAAAASFSAGYEHVVERASSTECHYILAQAAAASAGLVRETTAVPEDVLRHLPAREWPRAVGELPGRNTDYERTAKIMYDGCNAYLISVCLLLLACCGCGALRYWFCRECGTKRAMSARGHLLLLACIQYLCGLLSDCFWGRCLRLWSGILSVCCWNAERTTSPI